MPVVLQQYVFWLKSWMTQDFTAVFAAGNEGVSWKADDGLKTVTSPATSKNCISVGATNTAYQQAVSATTSQFVVYRMSISQVLGGGSQIVDNYKVCD